MGWFPVGKGGENGWRLDIVSLLAVIGESSMEAHSQALTSSWTCMLPRIIAAPQALLTDLVETPNKPKPRVPSNFYSALNTLSIASFSLTIGLIIWAAMEKDGTAIVAVAMISFGSSIVGYASW